MKGLLTTDEIIQKIHSGKSERDTVIEELYRSETVNHRVKGYLVNLGVEEDKLQTIFNLALVRFVKTVVKNKEFRIHSSLTNYLCGVAKLTFYDELRSSKPKDESSENLYEIIEDTTPESLTLKHEKQQITRELLNKLGPNCREVLMYWGNGYKMAEIAKLTGYASEGMAKKKKHQCFKSLLLYLNENPHVKKLLR